MSTEMKAASRRTLDSKVVRTDGIAGQFMLSSEIIGADGEREPFDFVSSIYGGPIVMVTPGFPKGFRVDAPERFGTEGLTPAWVQAFFAGTDWCMD